MIILRIAVRGPDETPVRAPKALVLILELLFRSNVVQLIKLCAVSQTNKHVQSIYVHVAQSKSSIDSIHHGSVFFLFGCGHATL